MEASTRARAEEFWARRLSIPAALLRTPGLHLLPHPLPNGFFILGGGESLVALAPPALHSGLAALGSARLLDRASLLELLPPGARCIGPTFVGYTEIEPAAPAVARSHSPTRARPRSRASVRA